jgi:hypothetical protein
LEVDPALPLDSLYQSVDEETLSRETGFQVFGFSDKEEFLEGLVFVIQWAIFVFTAYLDLVRDGTRISGHFIRMPVLLVQALPEPPLLDPILELYYERFMGEDGGIDKRMAT